MQLKAKINYPKYFILSAPSTAIAMSLAKNSVELAVIMGIYLITIINQLMLVRGTENYLSKISGGPKGNLGILLLIIGKMAVLLFGISLGVHFMGKRVIIPLLNYVILIIVLAYSVKKVEVQ
ncbi:MAG: hypothetical protein A2504_06430 [Bdellovibrionales bacterium RIFOXYD12_FULL_39_22]|nr:MAG: hypothetical protein A2385_08750 [Bdellovibrionales bacterium RIFOXYB1_FULL_39_21]OFZ45208.1 MAG: hypothetical protein A2485_05780 [Bdellovibrionales bacterium RIFOXYC12_FULL_39_17]OFZ45599.1 MAG: hypothetical protein A2404_03330 [Bdellovibrionales bacterium RIFOXYC1_FULL_39_130]OFZ77461.1 MAG: hypothetical protein A2560_08920 [Bdellovibrionales bacterium RIFOXYD1_FULL_39_84]OFZ91590.1 MAG: hypothetical protein A2504_06430 [Bdellovibrionales bacterium RIFOXYD12_FULL_39_22]HLE11950.1 hy